LAIKAGDNMKVGLITSESKEQVKTLYNSLKKQRKEQNVGGRGEVKKLDEYVQEYSEFKGGTRLTLCLINFPEEVLSLFSSHLGTFSQEL
jgi:hypothetical protein